MKDLPNWNVEFTPRECGMVIQALAAYAVSRPDMRKDVTKAALKLSIPPAEFEKLLKECSNYAAELIAPGQVDWDDDKGHPA